LRDRREFDKKKGGRKNVKGRLAMERRMRIVWSEVSLYLSLC